MSSTFDIRNLVIALILSSAVLFVWHVTVELPQQKQAAKMAEIAKRQEALQPEAKVSPSQEAAHRAELARSAGEVKLYNENVHGRISLLGARFDMLTLAHYHETVDSQSPEVSLLSPVETVNPYFSEFGWTSEDGSVAVPGPDSVWKADNDTLSPGHPVSLKWDNGQGLRFILEVEVDEHYLFTVTQRVVNQSGKAVKLHPYGLINRSHAAVKGKYAILHEGPLGVSEGTLTEMNYDKLKKEGPQQFTTSSGWWGITDKYWLTALIPSPGEAVKGQFSQYEKDGRERFQVDFLGPERSVADGESGQFVTRFFAGAKELKLLDAYAAKYDIPLFDRAVDLGVLYFLTKPLFLLLTFFHSLVGNFGIAILLLTVLIKLLMFPLANKSYVAMAALRRLQPEVQKIREQCADDKLRLNQEMMALYKREKVNPAAGCLPLLVQIPVFFALYKVLFVTIEMRHAPFYGWINDLSAMDPTNIFTLFGLVPWVPPAFLHVGLWPLFMSITMIIQQKLNPQPTDPVQAKLIAWLPYIFLFVFASFPAGLVIYWTWSNSLSIIQQYVITLRHGDRKKKPATAKS